MTESTAVPSETSSLLHESSHHHHQSLRLEEDVPYYAPPKQRQRWGESQVLPHVNWGDLYWDLFYVSGAFNLAAALKERLDKIGMLYFVACYISVFMSWMEKVSYDARYVPDDNLFHRLSEGLQLLVLGTMIQHIRSADIMEATSENATTFVFCASLALQSAMVVHRYADIYRNVIGGPESRHSAAREMLRHGINFACYLMAALWAGYDYFGSSSESNPLAVNHAPIVICLFSFLVGNLVVLSSRYLCLGRNIRTHHEIMVPINIEFMAHRVGEWTMLMLGESVLALLIVEASAQVLRYYVTFYAGVVSVTIFQYLFFRSQPFEADDHAMRRSSSGGFTFLYGMIVYSASLILVGCSYKMILHYYLDEDEIAEEGELEEHRLEMAAYRHDIAQLFSRSMAASFFSLDFMIVSHRGWAANLGRLNRCMPILVSTVTMSLLVLTLCLPWITTDLKTLSLWGCGIVVAQLLLRTRGLRYFPVSKQAMENCT